MLSVRNFPVFPSFSDAFFSDRFNRIDRLFSQLTGDTPLSLTPSYDLKQLDDEHYALTVSVPGWQASELDIEVAGGQLTVTGKKENTSDEGDSSNGSWLHQGISRTDFRLSYRVPEHMQVTQARLQDGLLSVGLRLEIPESEKPRRIPIERYTAGVIEHQA